MREPGGGRTATGGPGAGGRLGALAALLALCLGAAALGGAVTALSVDGWYRTIAKPSFNPPDAVFAPVWTALYLMMAVAAWRAWCRPPSAARRHALTLFAAQLALNLLWSCLFFGLREIGLALAEIVLLTVAVAATTHQLWRVDRLAGWLMLPYLGWLVFATVLNAAIWRLN